MLSLTASRDSLHNVWNADLERQFLCLIGCATLLSGVMFLGYAIFDEIALYVIVFMMCRNGIGPLLMPSNPIHRTHFVLYILFVIYFCSTTLRGALALSDPRVLRFTGMFLLLLVVALFANRRAIAGGDNIRFVHALTAATAIYLVGYLLVGVLYENFLGLNRFDLQGQVWSGTSTALFPLIAFLPALIKIGGMKERRNARIYWVAYLLAITVVFYYQSRFGMLALALGILLGARVLGLRRLCLSAVLFVLFVVFFPWWSMSMLSPATFVNEIGCSRQDCGFAARIERFRYMFTGLNPTHYAMPQSVTPPTHQPTSAAEEKGAATDDLRSVDLTDADRRVDLDRIVAIHAGFRCLDKEGLARWLFGTGFYHHRFEMISCFKEIADVYGFVPPQSYSHIVRTASFNGFLVDTGLVGMVLLLALFGVTAWAVVSARAPLGPVCLGALGLAAFSTLVSFTYDLLLFYLMVMPGGLLISCLGTRAKRVT